MAVIDPAILEALPGPSTAYSYPHSFFSLSSFGTTSAINRDGRPAYFLKTSRSLELLEGEQNALKIISSIVPSFCPMPVAIGSCANDLSRHFLVTTYLKNLSSGRGCDFERSLAEKLAQLHTTGKNDTYGLPDAITTCCGSTRMPNPPTSTWLEFFKVHRLKFILDENTRINGIDPELQRLGNKVLDVVVPRLLSPVKSSPSLIHGDLWRGNVGVSTDSQTGLSIPVVYDSCAYYADSEFELGIMSMFGGFSSLYFYQPYHKLVKVKEPEAEYDDRICLYRLFHELNHSALFGGSGYDDQAKSTMRALLKKYG
ncbi:Fructosamine/Ketosamine-3-kinase [Limtongia smithiae]|uniref:Fructosamine/Ketosamine-3-kinase n=1 Tax=Limtongia smithiae TaxID=1125753 RepID=UPI0034CF3267